MITFDNTQIQYENGEYDIVLKIPPRDFTYSGSFSGSMKQYAGQR